jgi:excisionase family DNA binding protein
MNRAFEKHALTIHEACSYSGIGKTKIYEAINAGKLKARKVGKRTLILSDELREFLSSLPLMAAPVAARQEPQARSRPSRPRSFAGRGTVEDNPRR